MTTLHSRWCTLLLLALISVIPSSHAAEGRIPRIGLLTRMFPDEPLTAGFRQQLRELGYIEGKTIFIERRDAATGDDKLPALAAELVRMKVDVMVTSGTPTAHAAVAATKSIPIVCIAVGDPVATGLAASLARPGRNATGVSILSSELVSKRFDLLHQLAPQASRVAFLGNFSNPATSISFAGLRLAVENTGAKLLPIAVRRPSDVETALRSATWKSADAALIGADLYFIGKGDKLARAVRAAKLPAIFPWQEYHRYGVLMSYGANLNEVFRRGAYYVDKILKGAKPSELPFEQVTKFELVIDTRVAQELGIKVSQDLLYRADRVIR